MNQPIDLDKIHQPGKGYLPPETFKVNTLSDKHKIHGGWNISEEMVVTAVKYLINFLMEGKSMSTFISAWIGSILTDFLVKKLFDELCSKVKGLDDESIVSACKLIVFIHLKEGDDVRKLVDNVNPNHKTIEDIKVMVTRFMSIYTEQAGKVLNTFSLKFWNFRNMNGGGGSFVTKDSFWTVVISSHDLTKEQTLKVLVKFLLGDFGHVKDSENIRKIQVYNPLLNKIYYCEISLINYDNMVDVIRNVIGTDEKNITAPIKR